MRWLYFTSVWLHVLAAAVWIGGMAFVVLVVMPLHRRDAAVDADGAKSRFEAAVTRFRIVGWAAILTLLVTGVVQLGTGPRPLAAWVGPLGPNLAAKLTLVFLALGLAAAHDFEIGPRALSLPADSPEGAQLRKVASWLGRIVFLLSLVILALAINLVR